MKFKVGKCYEHTTGLQIKIIGRCKSTMFGKCLVAETDSNTFVPISKDEEAAVNFKEISNDEWMKNFS
jgi:hypothetical protein